MRDYSTPETKLLKQRIEAAEVQMRANLNATLFSDHPSPPRPRPTMRQRLRRFLDRAHDAWLVLTGKAEIG